MGRSGRAIETEVARIARLSEIFSCGCKSIISGYSCETIGKIGSSFHWVISACRTRDFGGCSGWAIVSGGAAMIVQIWINRETKASVVAVRSFGANICCELGSFGNGNLRTEETDLTFGAGVLSGIGVLTKSTCDRINRSGNAFKASGTGRAGSGFFVQVVIEASITLSGKQHSACRTIVTEAALLALLLTLEIHRRDKTVSSWFARVLIRRHRSQWAVIATWTRLRSNSSTDTIFAVWTRDAILKSFCAGGCSEGACRTSVRVLGN